MAFNFLPKQRSVEPGYNATCQAESTKTDIVITRGGICRLGLGWNISEMTEYLGNTSVHDCAISVGGENVDSSLTRSNYLLLEAI